MVSVTFVFVCRALWEGIGKMELNKTGELQEIRYTCTSADPNIWLRLRGWPGFMRHLEIEEFTINIVFSINTEASDAQFGGSAPLATRF
jgi:hypothetical protein